MQEPSGITIDSPENKPAHGLARQDWIAGLDKGLGILETFGDAHPRLTAAQMGELAGMTRTAARRYLLTLTHLGYVATDGKLFWLTPRVLRLSQRFLESNRLARIVQPFLQRITAGTQESAFLSMLEGDDIVYVARNGASRFMNTGYVLGARVPANATAAGTLLLALRESPHYAQWLETTTLRTFTQHTVTDKEQLALHFAHIRREDWAISENQLEMNFRGIAVPLRDARGAVVGALSVTMQIGTESGQAAAQRVLDVLRETATTMRNLI